MINSLGCDAGLIILIIYLYLMYIKLLCIFNDTNYLRVNPTKRSHSNSWSANWVNIISPKYETGVVKSGSMSLVFNALKKFS